MLGDSVEKVLKDVPEIVNNFTVISKIGTGQCSAYLLKHVTIDITGTFSTVYLACLKKNPSQCYALKHIVETSVSWRIENELKCLTLMR